MRPYDALINRFLEIIQEVRGGANTDREKELLDEVKSLVDQIDEKEFSVQRIPPKSINISSLPPEQRKGIDLAMKEMRVQPCALEALERARKFNEQNSLGKSISSYGQDSIKTLSVHGREFEILIKPGMDGYFIGSAVELPGCHSQAKSIDEKISALGAICE